MYISCDTERYLDEVIGRNEYRGVFEDLVVIDVGCNIGAFSFWIYPLVKKLYAIDISQVNIDNMNKTCDEGHLSKIKTFCAGISGTGGRRKYRTFSDAGYGAWRLDEEGTLEIQTFTVKEFLDMEHIDYVDVLKIDIEGGEHEVFNRNFPTKQITTIVGEFHGSLPKDQLELLGYRVFDCGNGKFVARRI